MTSSNSCQKQVARFLGIMHAMNLEASQSFGKIYHLAPKQGSAVSRGEHVRLAMMEAVRHPQIAYWVRLNLVVRVGMKFARITGHAKQVQRLNALLDAFHLAAEAYMENQSAEQHHRPPSRWENVLPLSLATEGVGDWITQEELFQIRQFKHQVIPGLIKTIRKKQHANQ